MNDRIGRDEVRSICIQGFMSQEESGWVGFDDNDYEEWK